MEDTGSSQTSRPSFDPMVQAFATAIFDRLTSRAAITRAELEDVRAGADRIAGENAAFGVDAAGRRWLMLCAVLLAAYQRLLRTVGNSATAASLLQTSMTTPFRAGIQAFIRDRFGILQDAPHEAFDRIAGTFQNRGEQRVGRTFTLVPVVTDDRHGFSNITTCLFNDFFRAHGVPLRWLDAQVAEMVETGAGVRPSTQGESSGVAALAPAVAPSSQRALYWNGSFALRRRAAAVSDLGT